MNILITPKTKQELAILYGCSPKTIMRMCKDINIVTKKVLFVNQVLAFYEAYGPPSITVIIEDLK